eukprot:7637526-Ditylum_brightwellii.AAC.1
MKKGHAECSAKITEEKKAQIMESKDDVYICKEWDKMVTLKFAFIVLRMNAVVMEPITKHVNRIGHVMIVWVRMLDVAGTVDTIKTSWQKK